MLQKKWLRVLLWTISGLVASVFMLFVAVYFTLKSQAMHQRTVQSLKAPLAKQGVDLSVQALSIDLFAGVHLEGLKVVIKREPEIVGDLTMEDLRLRYSIWPLL